MVRTFGLSAKRAKISVCETFQRCYLPAKPAKNAVILPRLDRLVRGALPSNSSTGCTAILVPNATLNHHGPTTGSRFQDSPDVKVAMTRIHALSQPDMLTKCEQTCAVALSRSKSL